MFIPTDPRVTVRARLGGEDGVEVFGLDVLIDELLDAGGALGVEVGATAGHAVAAASAAGEIHVMTAGAAGGAGPVIAWCGSWRLLAGLSDARAGGAGAGFLCGAGRGVFVGVLAGQELDGLGGGLDSEGLAVLMDNNAAVAQVDAVAAADLVDATSLQSAGRRAGYLAPAEGIADLADGRVVDELAVGDGVVEVEYRDFGEAFPAHVTIGLPAIDSRGA